MLGCMQVHAMRRCPAKTWGAVTSDHPQSLFIAGRRCWTVDRENSNLLIAARPLQLDFQMTGSALILAEVCIPDGVLEAPSHLQPTAGEKGMPLPGEMEEFVWQQFFSDSTHGWDYRGSKPTPRHPDFRLRNSKVAQWINNRHKSTWVDSQLAIWGAGMKRPPESLSTSCQGQGHFGRLGALEGHLEVGMCRKLCEDGRVTEAVDLLKLLVQRGCHVDNNLYYRVLKRCIALKDLVLGRRIHALTIESGYEGDAFLATHLIGMYASHARMEEATQVFTKVSSPNVYNWASIIFAYARHGEAVHAIRLYRQMRESTTAEPDGCIYVAVLKACAIAGDLIAGKEVHAHILARPSKPDILVQIGLFHMFTKCASLGDARSIFDRLPERNVVIWNAMIAGYAQHGMGQEALSIYTRMQQDGLTPPDFVTYICLLQACACDGVRALQRGKQLHAEIEEQGLQGDVILGGSLVNMYAKCGSLDDARRIFDRLPDRNVVAWTAIIAGYTHWGMGQEALSLYNSMQQEGLNPPDSVTYACLLQACASLGVGGLDQGKQLHTQIEEQGLQAVVLAGNSLVNMYAKCGSLEDARSVFDRLPNRNVVTWTALISGYAQQGMGEEALRLYSSMQQEAIIIPNSVTFVCLLQACASAGVGALDQGKLIHAQMEEQGLQDDVVLGCSLVDMYAKCGSLEDAQGVFDRFPARDIVAWNALIAGYAQQGMGQEALSLYSSMQQQGVTPDLVTCVCLLQACASVGVGALDQGRLLHVQIGEQGFEADVVVGNSLVNMYGKCGSLEDARIVFDRLPDRNVVTWTALIAGYVQQGMGEEALNLYGSMQQEGTTTPNSVTFVWLLQGCASVAALPQGKQLHAQIEERGLEYDVGVGAALVNMYAKCGSMFYAQQVFDSLPQRTIEAWGALTAGYTRKGDSEVVFTLFDRMRLEGRQPDGIMFVSVLTVCSHVGLVDKGQKYFEAMRTQYDITPTLEHYTCMVDLLGRAGHLDEALQMAKAMPFPPNSAVWRTLLSACRKWKNVEIGQQAFEFAVSVDGRDASSYVLMSNIYASAEMWEEAKEMQARRVKSGAWKEPGQSWWTDTGGVVHTFGVGDKTHPRSEDIYARLQQLHVVPHTELAGHIYDEQDAELQYVGTARNL